MRLVTLPTGANMTGAAGDVWTLDLGELSYPAAPRNPNVSSRRLPHSFVISTEFGVQVQSSGSPTPGTPSFATLLAFLQDAQPQYSVRIDGVTLQSGSQPVASHLRSGAITVHRLEIEIPTTVTEKSGRLAHLIEFSVVPD